MSPNDRFRDRGRRALLAGDIHIDTPPVDDGPRWGISAVLRPTGPVADTLADLGKAAAAVAGPGHWVHPPGVLHTTLRSFEPHSTRDLTRDPRIAGYLDALTEACAGSGPVGLDLLSATPFGGGVAVLGDESDKGLTRLRERLVAALDARGIVDHESTMVRDLWYVTLLHFAAPVADPSELVAWGDAQQEHPVGPVRYSAVDLIRWWHTGTGIAAEVVHTVPLGG